MLTDWFNEDDGRFGDMTSSGFGPKLRPWALNDQGIRCIIAPSFADIFFNKCAWLRNTLGRCVVALNRVAKSAEVGLAISSIFEGKSGKC